MNIESLVRPNIRKLKPYSSARSLIKQNKQVLMDANENPFSELGRYPDPKQSDLREVLAEYYKIPSDSILPGNGSDEIIDLLFRVFTEPGRSNVLIPQPTYGMYEVAANIQNCYIKKVMLDGHFQPDADYILKAADKETKMIFLCSPNNPTGNLLKTDAPEKILRNFNGLVIIDQAYLEFSDSEPWRNRIKEFPNLVVLQTFSKAWGMAGIRGGLAFTNPEIIQWLMRIKLPYNLNQLTQRQMTQALKTAPVMKNWVNIIVNERNAMIKALNTMSAVVKVYPSDANYLLVKFRNSELIYEQLKERGIIVRNRSNMKGCKNTLRISIGTPRENSLLLKTLQNLIPTENQPTEEKSSVQ